MRVRMLCVAVLLAVVLPRVSLGQTAAPPKKAEPPTLKFTVHPSAEPVPALKYQLLPNLLERKRGNAAVQYNKLAIQTNFEEQDLDRFTTWNSVDDTPLGQLPLAEVRAALAKHKRLLGDLDTAARFNQCDWQLLDGQVDLYAIRLPELQSLRQVSQLLGVRTRLEIAEGRYDDAVHSLQTGYALGRHSADSSTLVGGLVGIACSSIVSSHVAELVQQPDAPSFYWALSSLPDPLIDLRPGYEGEMYSLHLSCPELADIESTVHNEQYWRDAVKSIWTTITRVRGGLSEDSFPAEAAVALMAARGYPMARQALIEQGRSAEEVDRMPVSQVIAIYTVRTYGEFRDDLFKWFHVPYWQMGDTNQIGRELVRESRSREVIPIASLVLPAVGAAIHAQVRCDREIRMLRIVEAIRMHGRLPKKLGDITEVPIPLDPGTCKPFKYEVKGDTATLEADVPADRVKWFGRRYEIRFSQQ